MFQCVLSLTPKLSSIKFLSVFIGINAPCTNTNIFTQNHGNSKISPLL